MEGSGELVWKVRSWKGEVWGEALQWRKTKRVWEGLREENKRRRCSPAEIYETFAKQVRGNYESNRLCEIELANSIKDTKNFFKYFSNNKKQKSGIGLLHEEGENITTDI